ncbi:MAG: hypothetical protein ACFFCC_18525 [Promethearchaeota archaeon]
MLDKQDKEILKLIKYCEHWADHNNSHKESYIKWRDVANEKGLKEVAQKLDKAIEMLDKCNEYLLTARSFL